MRRLEMVSVLCAAIVVAAPSTCFAAGPYTDDLSKCLVRSTSSADKVVLVQWMFATMALHPDVSSLSSVSEGQRAELNKKVGALFQRLITDSCEAETRAALKYEGNPAIEGSFSVLGSVAVRELFANPRVAAGLADLQKVLDLSKLSKDQDTKQ